MSADLSPTAPEADRARMVEQAEQARERFHTLLGSLDAADLSRSSAVSRWTVQAVLAHMVSVLGQGVPLMLANARRGRPMPALLRSRPGNWLVYRLTQAAARRSSRPALAAGYDRAHAALLAAGAGLHADDWARTTTLGYGNTVTVEMVLVRLPLWHVRLHTTEIAATLGRPLPEAGRGYAAIEAEPLGWVPL